MEKKDNLFDRIRPHAEWETIKLLWEIAGGSALFTSVYGIIQRALHSRVDWTGLGILFVLCVIALCLMVLLVRRSLSSRKPQSSHLGSKLVIHSAKYYAPKSDERYDVTDFLSQIIVGDSVAFQIENHNFVVNDHNYVPKDPAPSKTKWLKVEYSFNHGPTCSLQRPEHSLLVLPEDPYLKTQATEANPQSSDQGLFTTVQIEAFRLASDIRKFEKEIGPRPTIPMSEYHGPHGVAGGLTFQQNTESAWVERLASGYVLRFASKVKELRFRFGAAGVDAPYRLDRFMENIISETDLQPR